MQPLTIDLPEATGRNLPAATGTPRAFTRRWPYVAGAGLALALAVAPVAAAAAVMLATRLHLATGGVPGPGDWDAGDWRGADGRDDPPPGTARPVGDRRGRGDPPRQRSPALPPPSGRRCCWSPGWSRSPSPGGGTATARPGPGIWPRCRPRAIVASVRQTRPVTDLPRAVGGRRQADRVCISTDRGSGCSSTPSASNSAPSTRTPPSPSPRPAGTRPPRWSSRGCWTHPAPW